VRTVRSVQRRPERIVWAVELVDPGPAESLLEIGCGPGVAAGLVCERLSTGRLLAIDRSVVAVERTANGNVAHIAAGRLEVRKSALQKLRLPAGSLDKAFSVDVDLFWTGRADRELAVLHAALRPGGQLYVLYGAAGPTGADRVTSAVAASMLAGGFQDVRIVESDRGVGVRAGRP
jgi:SAM-dependent methyltransferase